MKVRTSAWIAGLIVLPIATAGHAQNWPAFRGPQMNGVCDSASLPVEWSADERIVWKIALPGMGWSQPIAWDGKIYLTLAVTDKQPKPRPGDFGMGGSGPGGMFGSGVFSTSPPDAKYRWRILCLDGATGKIIWDRTAREGRPAIRIHANNTYASETPATDGQRLIASFGMTGIYCYDLAGTLLWTKDLGAYPTHWGWGTASSPVIHDGRVFIQCDNDKSSFLVALDVKTGDELWRATREEKTNWGTPYIWKSKSRTELVAAGGTKMRSYDPRTGKMLWGMNACGRTAITPVGDEELLYVDSADRLTGGRGILAAIKPGASGDITPAAGQDSGQFVAWSVPLNYYRVASPLLYEGCLYLLEQQSGTIRCLDAKTGKLNYRQRLTGPRGFTASPWAAGGKVFCLDETGLTIVLQPGPTLQVIGNNRLDEMFWSSAAVVGDNLLLRGRDNLYCIGK